MMDDFDLFSLRQTVVKGFNPINICNRRAENSLELLELELIDWSLEMLTSISILILCCACEFKVVLRSKENCIFANSPLGTTILDSNIVRPLNNRGSQ